MATIKYTWNLMNCHRLAAKDWEVEKEASDALEKTERLTELSWNCTDETKLDQLSYQAPSGYQSQSGFTNSAGRTVLLQVHKHLRSFKSWKCSAVLQNTHVFTLHYSSNIEPLHRLASQAVQAFKNIHKQADT